jgi:hypothetical protein
MLHGNVLIDSHVAMCDRWTEIHSEANRCNFSTFSLRMSHNCRLIRAPRYLRVLALLFKLLKHLTNLKNV